MKFKTVAVAGVSLIVIVIGLMIYVFSSLDGIVQAGIESGRILWTGGGTGRDTLYRFTLQSTRSGA